MAENKQDSAEQQAQAHGDFDKDKGVSGQGGTSTGPVSGSAANTRGENKPSKEGDSGGAKQGKEVTAQDPNANSTTTTRGSDSTDKEFRNDQPNSSTLKGFKESSDLGMEKE